MNDEYDFYRNELENVFMETVGCDCGKHDSIVYMLQKYSDIVSYCRFHKQNFSEVVEMLYIMGNINDIEYSYFVGTYNYLHNYKMVN